ncbi:hypothetical protein ACJJTC_010332 [Scirpophaga incertulas]
MSPTSGTWDGISLVSLPFDDHRGRGDERGGVVSPRLERAASSLSAFSQLSLLDKGLALFDKGRPPHRGVSRDEPPSPRDRHSPRHDRQPMIVTTGERKPQALSPRGAIVDAELFYSRNNRKPDQSPLERVPPLLPRSSPGAPPPPPRPSSPHHQSATWSPPGESLPSPKIQDLSR